MKQSNKAQAYKYQQMNQKLFAKNLPVMVILIVTLILHIMTEEHFLPSLFHKEHFYLS